MQKTIQRIQDWLKEEDRLDSSKDARFGLSVALAWLQQEQDELKSCTTFQYHSHVGPDLRWCVLAGEDLGLDDHNIMVWDTVANRQVDNHVVTEPGNIEQEFKKVCKIWELK